MDAAAKKEISEIVSYSLPPGGLIRLMRDIMRERTSDMPLGGKIFIYSGAVYMEAVRLGCFAYVAYEKAKAIGIL